MRPMGEELISMSKKTVEVLEGVSFEAQSGGVMVSAPRGGISRLFDAPILDE